MPALQVAGRLGEDDFEGRAHFRRQQVAAARGAVALAVHHVRVDFLAVSTLDRDVAEQGKHLGLLAHRNALVVLFLPVEIAERGFAERADGAEARGREVLLLGEARQPFHRVLARVENHGEHALVVIVDELCAHAQDLATNVPRKNAPAGDSGIVFRQCNKQLRRTPRSA